jgi:hypothetical protein
MQLSINAHKFPRHGRDGQIKAFFNAIEDRKNRRDTFLQPGDRQSNPLPGTHGAPGTGKSFLLDEIASFEQEDIEKFCPDNVKPIPSNIVSVLITYNSLSPYDVTLDRDHYEAGLALRALWRFVDRLVHKVNFIVSILRVAFECFVRG